MGAGLAVGTVWAIWHVPALMELGRPGNWIVWWSVWTVSQRIIMAFLYIRGGSWVWGPVIFHAISNAAWQAAPYAFDPFSQGLLMAAVAAAVALRWSRGTRCDC